MGEPAGEKANGKPAVSGGDVPIKASASKHNLTSRDTENMLLGAEIFYATEENGAVAPLERLMRRVTHITKEEFEQLQSQQGVYLLDDTNRSIRGGDAYQFAGLSRPSMSLHVSQTEEEEVADSRASYHRSEAPMSVPRKKQSKSIFGLATFRPDTKSYLWWSLLILILDLTYTSFVVPISIGMLTSFWTANAVSILDYTCGAIFFADLILSFHVGYVGMYMSRKVLVMDGKIIARHYLKSNFIYDLASSIAWIFQIILLTIHVVRQEVVDLTTAQYIMEVVRLIRFLRIFPLLSYLSNSALYSSRVSRRHSKYMAFLSNSVVIYSMLVLYIAFVIVNFLGCLWNFVAGIRNYDNTWVNYYHPFLVYVGSDADYLTEEEIKADLSDVYLYFTGTYFAVTTIVGVGYGDIVPRNLAEMMVAQAMEFLAILFQAVLFGTVAELVRRGNTKTRRLYELRYKMDHVERWMELNNLPSSLREKIKAYYAEVWLQHTEGQEELRLFRELPHSLQNEVAWECTNDYLKSSPLLRDLSEEKLHLLTGKMYPVKWGPGAEIATEGELADRVWILLEGEVMSVFNFKNAEVWAAPYVIGETVLLQDIDEQMRTYPCTYRTLTHCLAWCLRYKDVQLLLKHDPHALNHVSDRASNSVSMHIAKHPNLWSGVSIRSDSVLGARTRSQLIARDSMRSEILYSNPSAPAPVDRSSIDIEGIDERSEALQNYLNSGSSAPGLTNAATRRGWGPPMHLRRSSAPPGTAAGTRFSQIGAEAANGGGSIGKTTNVAATGGMLPPPTITEGKECLVCDQVTAADTGRRLANLQPGEQVGASSASPLRSIMFVEHHTDETTTSQREASSPFLSDAAAATSTAQVGTGPSPSPVRLSAQDEGFAASPRTTQEDAVSLSQVLRELRNIRQEVSLLRHPRDRDN